MEARATNGCQRGSISAGKSSAAAVSGTSEPLHPSAAMPPSSPECPRRVQTNARATSARRAKGQAGGVCAPSPPRAGSFRHPCKLVGRANDALGAGRPFATVRAWLATNEPQQTPEDQNDTANGCDAGQQAAWEARIAANLRRCRTRDRGRSSPYAHARARAGTVAPARRSVSRAPAPRTNRRRGW